MIFIGIIQIECFIYMNFPFFSCQETLSMTEDFAIDIPQVCDYLGEIFGKFKSSGNSALLHL